MAFTKLTTNVNYIQALSDTPNETDHLTADQLKAEFDKAGNTNKTAFNGLIDELEATTGAASLGADAMDLNDVSSANVQAKLDKLNTDVVSLKAGGVTDGAIATAKLANGAVTTAKLADANVTTSKINDGAVTADKIGSSAVTTGKINNGAVTGEKLDTNAKKAENITATPMSEEDESDGNVQAKLGKLASDMTSISQGSVADGAITTAKLDDLAVTTAKIKNLNVTTPKINDGAITSDKIASGFGLIPSGGIIMWSGVSVPTGWYLCNGENGTPDLRNRFIVGSGDEYSTGNTGGEKEHVLTVEEMPSHSHSYSVKSTTIYPGSSSYKNIMEPGSSTTGTSGGGQAHENRPPYYALAFIMKA